MVLISAVGHVYWNFRLKRALDPAIFAWWLQVFGSGLCLVLAAFSGVRWTVPPAGWACAFATGAVYAAYYCLMAESYNRADLTRAYPIARGVAPVASLALGVLLLGENPSKLGWIGIATVCCGLWVLAFGADQGEPRRASTGVGLAVMVGLCAAAYSAIDKKGVSLVSPVLYLGLTFAIGSGLQGMVLLAGGRRGAFLREIRNGPVELLSAVTVATLSYLLVLAAMQSAPVSYIVPLRSTSVLLSLVVGRIWLGERVTLGRAVSGALVVVGIALISLFG